MNTPLVDNDLASIRQELNELRAEMAALRKNGHGNHNGLDVLADPTLTDRRGMMKKMAGLAVGVAAVGLLRPSSSKARTPTKSKTGSRTPHTTGDFLVLGDTNDADVQTNLINSTTDLIPASFVAGNYGDVFFVNPTDASIGIVGYTSSDGATAGDTNDLFGVYGQAVGGNSSTGGFFVGDTAAIGTGVGGGAVEDPNATDPAGGSMGDFYRGSSNGSIWYRAGGAGSYRRVVDDTTAGALTPFPSSSRFVNLSPLAGGATGTYQIGGVTVTGNTVPAKARAIIARIADANPTGAGALLVGATNPPVGGVIAIVAGAPQNSFFFSALDATGKLYVKNSSASGSVNVIIDVLGYYE